MQLIAIDHIHDNPYQGQRDYADIDVLARTIAAQGLKQNPAARLVAGAYQLEFGHRRLRAFRWLAEHYQAEGLQERYDGYTVMPIEIQELSDEQMFEGVVVENEHRKGTDPIEKGRMMKAYRDDFKKSSTEIGLLFGVNDATVRGMIRLLDLHPDAQGLLSRGMISQGTARALLSAQKILDEKALRGLLAKLANTSADDHEQLIENVIERSDNTVEMWGRWESERGGKPRAGQELWLLDMKNFPNKLLADMSVIEAAELIGIQKNKADYEILKKWMIDYDQGAATTEDGWNALEFSGLHQEHIDRLRHLIDPPACNACPFYAVVNKAHYCGVKICRQRKTEAFKAQKLADMSRTLKIAVYTENDGAYLLLDEDIAAHRKAYEARHADLRLVPVAMIRGYAYQHFKDADSSTAKIVAVGESASRLVVSDRMKTKGGKKSESEKAEMRAKRLYRARRLELTWEYTAEAQVIFEGVPLKVIRKLREWHYVGVDDAIPDEYKHSDTGAEDRQLDFARRALVWGMVVEKTSYYDRSKLAKALGLFETVTGVTASKALTARAEEWDAEIDALAKPVAAETPAKKSTKRS